MYLLPAGGSPRRPVEQQEDLATEVLQARGLALEIGEREGRRRLRRLVGLESERGEVGTGGAGGGREDEHRRQRQTDHRIHQAAPGSPTFRGTSLASGRSRGVS